MHCYADNVCDKNICVNLEKCRTETSVVSYFGTDYLNPYIHKEHQNTHTRSVSVSMSVSEYKSMIMINDPCSLPTL